jgi:hypothetical protein
MPGLEVACEKLGVKEGRFAVVFGSTNGFA